MERRTKEEWDKIITTWKTSGLPMSAYCRKNSISYWTFRENKLKRDTSDGSDHSEKGLVRISPPPKPVEPASPPITVILPDGIKLVIPDHFKTETLQKVIDVLGCVL